MNEEAFVGTSDSLFESLAETTAAAIFIFRQKFLYVNSAAQTLTGYSRNELLQMNFWDLVHPSFREMVRQRGEARLKGESAPERHEFQILTRDGGTRWVDFSARTIQYNGQPAGFGTAHDITQWKETERALKDSLSLLSATLDSTADGILVVDRNGRITSFNTKFAEMWHIPTSVLESRQDDRALAYVLDQLKDPDGFLNKVRELYQQHDASSFDILEFKDGRIFERYSQPQKIDGVSVGRVWSFRDVTQRWKSEEALREAHQFNEAIISSAGEGIVVYDRELRYVVWNSFMERLTGIPAREVLGKRAPDLFPHITLHGVDKLLLAALRGESTKTGDIPFNIERTGKHGWYVGTYVPHRNARGEIIGVIGVINDITERREAEEARRKSEERYRRYFEDDISGIFVSTPEGRLVDCNNTYVRMLGFNSIEEALRTSTYEMYRNPKDRDEYLALLRQRKRLEGYERELIRRDGRPINVIANVSGEFDNDGNLTLIRGYLFDVTERKRLEEDLRQAQKMESVGTLAGGMAHDFNNILGIIIGYATRLRSSVEESSPLARGLEPIIKAAERGAGLVKQLLTFARRTPVQREPLNVNETVEEIVQLLAETFPKTITIEQSLTPDLPMISADSNQLHQALLNLCLNARDAMPNGGTLSITTQPEPGERVRVRYPAATATRYVHIQVTDTGVGIDHTIKSRIFEPFFSTKGPAKGTGLGLSVVYGVVKSLEGFIDVNSKKGAGTTFSLHLPAMEHPQPTGDSKSIQQPMTFMKGTETILLVEDEEMLLDLLDALLTEHGYHILRARDGVEAVEVYREHQSTISLVLSDMGLPRLGGWQAFQQMREINPRVKVILASGYLDPNLRKEMIEAGAVDFIQKPYIPEEILKRIRSVIDGS